MPLVDVKTEATDEEAIDAVKKKYARKLDEPPSPPPVSDEEGEAAIKAVQKRYRTGGTKQAKKLKESLADVFKAVSKDLDMAPFAKPGEKQEKCKPGYFWCPIDKECKKEKKRQ